MTTKTDMERVGLFKELGYHTINDPYHAPGAVQFNKSATTGKQMLPGGEKLKSATTAGYFGEFGRVYDGESYTDLPKMRRQKKMESNKKRLGKDWVPASGNKQPSGLGSCYGTFAGPMSYFQAISKAQKESGMKGKNFYTNPAKQGTGYGYLGVTLGKYPEYKGDQYDAVIKQAHRESETHKNQLRGRGVFRLGMHRTDYFDQNPYQGPRDKYRSHSAASRKGGAAGQPVFRPSNPTKLDGGMKAGCINPFPEHSSDPYNPKVKGSKTDKRFLPSAGPKSMPSNSVLHQNITRTITPMNYRVVQSVMSY